MKKFLTIALALVMALALAAPAMAFISGSGDANTDLMLDIYLTEYEDADLFRGVGVFTYLPEEDRGYVTNEVAAAIVTLTAPVGADGGSYTLALTGENVKFLSNEEPIPNKELDDLMDEEGFANAGRFLGTDEDDGWILQDVDDLVYENDTKDDIDYQWLVFAKVLDDEASLTVELQGSAVTDDFFMQGDEIEFEYDNDDWTLVIMALLGQVDDTEISYAPTGGTASQVNPAELLDGNQDTNETYAGTVLATDFPEIEEEYKNKNIEFGMYALYEGAETVGNLRALFVFEDAFETVNMFIFPDGLNTATPANTPAYDVRVEKGDVNYYELDAADIGTFLTAMTTADGTPSHANVVAAKTAFDDIQKAKDPVGTKSVINDLDDIYEGVIGTGIGMSQEYVGEKVTPKMLKDALTSVSLSATVDIQPWQAYVTIPDIEVIDPPKTGDAATLAGFVMIVLAAAGVVVFKKVRA